jgi:two-component system OmpR family response regulator
MNEPTDQSPGQSDVTVAGEYILNRETIRVLRDGEPLQLSMRQFRLLEIFMQHPRELLSRTLLKERVWGPRSTVEDNTVDAEIFRLRRAITRRRHKGPIRTVRRLGYVFDPTHPRGHAAKAR